MIKTTADFVFVVIFGAAVVGLVAERVIHMSLEYFNEEVQPYEGPFSRAMRVATPLIGLLTSGGFLIWLQVRVGAAEVVHQMSVIQHQHSYVAYVGWMVFGLHGLVVLLTPIFLLRQVVLLRRFNPDVLPWWE
jgi:hypothetical protein